MGIWIRISPQYSWLSKGGQYFWLNKGGQYSWLRKGDQYSWLSEGGGATGETTSFDVPSHTRYSTIIKIPTCSKAIGNEQRPKFCSPSWQWWRPSRSEIFSINWVEKQCAINQSINQSINQPLKETPGISYFSWQRLELQL